MADPTLGDWAAVAGAVFTAAAAGAALLTTRQGKKLIEAAEAPLLDVQVIADPENNRRVRLAIINAGQGVARGSNFTVHAMGELTDNVIGNGYMQPGERWHVVTTIGPLPAPSGRMQHDVPDLGVMLAYRDAGGFVHYRTHAEVEYVPRTTLRRPKYPERTAVFKRLFPHIDLDSAERAQHNIVRPQ